MSRVFNPEGVPSKAKLDDKLVAQPFSKPRTPAGPPEGPGDVHHVPIPAPARTSQERR